MTTATLQNAADSYTLERSPLTNYNASTVLYTRTTAGNGCRAYLHFGVPFPKGVTILSAKLRLYQNAAVVGSATNVVQRIGASWSTSKVTWNNGPAVTGATVSLTKSNPASGTLWEWDVTALMQTVANGAAWYGFRVINTASTLTRFASAQSSSVAMRPTLEITWSDTPLAPTQLFPSSGRAVATNKPTLQFNFVDLAGDKTLQAAQVQINATDVWTAPSFDSGTVLTDTPEVDLSTTAYAGVGAGSTVFWRVRVQDGAGLWSNWSASTSFAYQTQGTLTVNNPALVETWRNYLNDPGSEVAADLNNNGVTWTVTRDTTKFRHGVASTKSLKIAGQVTTGILSTYKPNGALNSVVATPGETWTITRWFYTDTAGQQGQVVASWYNNTPANVSSSPSAFVPLVVGTWTKVSGTFVVPTGTGVTAILPMSKVTRVSGNAADNEAVWADDWVLTKGTYTGDYFDGSFTDTAEYDYSWAGTANASASLLKQPIVEDATPIISWGLTGRTQASFEVQVYYITPVLNKIGGQTTAKRLKWTSGKINSAATSYTIPSGVLNDTTVQYEIDVLTWDTILREAVPGYPVSVMVDRVFMLTNTTATTPVSGLTSTLDTYYPWVTLNWSRSSMPDKWNIVRNGKVIAVLDGDDPFVAGTNYTYLDRRSDPRVVNTYTVVASVNGRGSAGNPTTSQTPKAPTTLLSDVDGLYPVLIYSSEKDLRMDDDAFVFEPTGNAPPIVIFSATVNGYQGTVKGTLDSSVQNWLTNAQMRQRFETLAAAKGQKLLLTMLDETMEVFILNPVIKPRSVEGGGLLLFDVSFDFYQTDAI